MKNSLDMIYREGVLVKETAPAATYSIAKPSTLTSSALQQLDDKKSTAEPSSAVEQPLPLQSMLTFVNSVRFRPSTAAQIDASVGTLLKILESYVTPQSGAKL